MLSPEVIVDQSADAMSALDGFHFLIERTGAPALLSEEQSISFRRAEGNFVSPDRAQVAVRVIAPGIILDVQAISFDGRYWETHPVTGEWQEFPPEQGFNPAVLFAPQTGISVILREDLSELVMVGVSTLDALPGLELYEVQARMSGTHINKLSYGLIGPGAVDVRLWIDPTTFYLQRMMIEEAGVGENDATLWVVDLWDFGAIAEILPPDRPGTLP